MSPAAPQATWAWATKMTSATVLTISDRTERRPLTRANGSAVARPSTASRTTPRPAPKYEP